jgi:hypothetical protein
MRRRPQSAQAMVEFLIIIPVLILLIFGAVQAALIYSAKNGLNYATFQAARLGAMNHAQYSDIRRGLARGMYPMFSQVKSDRMKHTAREIDNYVLITRISPDQASFAAFAEPNEGLGVNIIPNDNLMFRSTQQAPVSIQDANLLKLRVQYCMRLIVPMVEHILSSASRFNTDKVAGSFNEGARKNPDYDTICPDGRNGFIITAEATVRMQSAAINDSEYCGAGKKMHCP